MALIDFVFTRAGEATRITKNGLLATVPSNFPVVNFDDGDLLGYYSQRAATNLLQRSEEFDNAYWTKQDVTIASNDTTAPDGTTTADKLQETATTAFHRVSRGIDVSAGANTISIYAKKSERNFLVIRSNLPTLNVNTTFNLDTGVVTFNGHTSAHIEALPNGWYRCSVSAVSTAKSTTFGYLTSNVDVTNNNLPSYLGVAGSGIFIWGAQLETGSEATSYIKTVDTTVTRNKDIATASGLTLSPLSNVQFKANFPSDYPLVIAGLQATVSGYRTIRLELSPTEKTLFVDGVEADTDTGTYDWSGITSIELGHFDGGEQPNFEIADLRINE
jgi:hypothetical protein